MAFPDTTFVSKSTVITAPWLQAVNDRWVDEVSVRDFGAVGNGITDDTGAIQDALDTGKSVFFPEGTYRTTATLNVATVGQKVTGAGQRLTIISADSLTGAVIRFKRSYHQCSGLTITSGVARTAAAYTAGAHGILCEPDDLPVGAYLGNGYSLNLHFHSIEITQQPGDGLALTGSIFNGSSFNNFRIDTIKGHAVSLNRGVSRSNPSQFAVGLCEFGFFSIFKCGGHGFAFGSPADNIYESVMRVVVNNADCGSCATDAAVRYADSTFWFNSINGVYNSCYAKDTEIGIKLFGSHNRVNNLRTQTVDIPVYIGNMFSGGSERSRDNIVENTNCVFATDTVVVTENNVIETKVVNNSHKLITHLIDNVGIEPTFGYQGFLIKKESDQVINNTDVPTLISGLSYRLNPGAEYEFEVCLTHQAASGTPNLKISFSWAGEIVWFAQGNVYFDASNVLQVSLPITTAAASPLIIYSDNVVRTIVVRGYIKNNGATVIAFQPRFAQNVATATNTTIFAGLSYMKLTRMHLVAV
jgi:hypothetical protein